MQAGGGPRSTDSFSEFFLTERNHQNDETRKRQRNTNRGHQNDVVESRARFWDPQNLPLPQDEQDAANYTIEVTEMTWLSFGPEFGIRSICP